VADTSTTNEGNREGGVKTWCGCDHGGHGNLVGINVGGGGGTCVRGPADRIPVGGGESGGGGTSSLKN